MFSLSKIILQRLKEGQTANKYKQSDIKKRRLMRTLYFH